MVRTERTYWTAEEDQRLVDQVAQHGTNKWVVIASSFEGKDNKSCSHRYNNYLDPLLNKAPFSPWEDSVVSQLYKEVGPRWNYIAKCLSGSQGRRSANTVKNRYQALKKYWVPLDPGAPPGSQETMASEDEEMGQAAEDNRVAVRDDAPGAATTSSQPQQQESGVAVEAMSCDTELLQGPGERPELKGPITGSKESAAIADGPLSHKFLVLQSRLHKASQLIARAGCDAKAWEHDKQKIFNHLDNIKNILDVRLLSLFSSPPPQVAAPLLPVPTSEAQPDPAARPPAEPQAESAPTDKEPDSRPIPIDLKAAIEAGKRMAETSELDIACILNDLANAPTEGKQAGMPATEKNEKKTAPPADNSYGLRKRAKVQENSS